MDPALAQALEREVAASARRADLLAPGDRVLVAVSGGRDSAATAALLVAAARHDLPLEVTLGHVDHGWRGPKEAKADLAVVRRLARRLGVKVLAAGPPDVVQRTEDAARRHRYGALERLAFEVGADKIATGHHLRDQAETYVMRLRRGAGPAGLAGIPPRRVHGVIPVEIVRPVLGVAPSRLAAYVEHRGLPWRDDPTNAHLDRDRVRVRAELAALGARAESETALLAEAADGYARALARREAEVRARLARGLFADVESTWVEVAAADFAALGEAGYATGLRVLGGEIGAGRFGPWFTRRHAAMVGALAAGERPSGTIELPRHVTARRRGDRLELFALPLGVAPSLLVPRDAEVTAADAGTRITARWREVARDAFDLEAWIADRRNDPPAALRRAAFDADRLGRRATVRIATGFDMTLPYGASRLWPVHEFARRDGVAERRWPGLRVLEAEDGGIAWTIGVRIDVRYAVQPTSARVAIVEVETTRG